MKKIIFIISITLLAFNSQAQGALQFNQVLTFKGNTTQSNIYTVPIGKVSKIVKTIQQDGNSYGLELTFNGSTTIIATDLSGMWLKENDVIGSIVGSSPYDNHWVLSIIEYNIIP